MRNYNLNNKQCGNGKNAAKYKKIFGKKGEIVAFNFLKKKGYDILQRNYSKKSGEIDIICKDPKDERVVFVEVKSRVSSSLALAEDSVDFGKVKRIIKTGEQYLAEKELDLESFRIDVIVVFGSTALKKAKIVHLENIEI